MSRRLTGVYLAAEGLMRAIQRGNGYRSTRLSGARGFPRSRRAGMNTRAGLPSTVVPAETSVKTAAPIATVAQLPTVLPRRIEAPAPTHATFPTLAPPERSPPAPMTAYGPMDTACPITAPILIAV